MNQEAGLFNIPRLLNFFIDNVVRGKEKEFSTEDEIDVSTKYCYHSHITI
jgi:hypothetical protein